MNRIPSNLLTINIEFSMYAVSLNLNSVSYAAITSVTGKLAFLLSYDGAVPVTAAGSVQQAMDFYILSGMNSEEAKEQALIILKREALYEYWDYVFTVYQKVYQYRSMLIAYKLNIVMASAP